MELGSKNLTLVWFFFHIIFLSHTMTIHRAAGEWKGTSLFPSNNSTLSQSFRQLSTVLHLRFNFVLLEKILCQNSLLQFPAGKWWFEFVSVIQKQPLRGVLRRRCSENMQQIFSRIPMPKCDFRKVVKQFYWNHTSAWVFSCKFAAYFRNTFF